MKKSFWHKIILFLFITVFAMAGFDVFARYAEAKTAAEIATEVVAAKEVVTTAQEAYDTALSTYNNDYPTALSNYNSALSVYNTVVTYKNSGNTTLQSSYDNALATLNSTSATLDAVNAALTTAQATLDAANADLTTVQAQKSDGEVSAETTSQNATAVAGDIQTNLSTPDTAGAQGVWTGTAWGTQSSSQATYDACASVPDVTTTATDISTGAEVTTTTKCDGSTIVKSTTKNADGTKTVVTTEKDASGTIIGTPTTETKASTSTTGDEDKLLEQQKEACSIWGGGDAIMACLSVGIYYYAYKPFSVLLQVAGYIFDSSIVLSIDKNFVNQDFIKTVWTVIRDFSNMLFIFVLLFAGIQTMFGLGNYKETIRLVIIIALLINFSLFFTKVVIDAGNILAVGVFQAMGVTKTSTVVATKTGGVPERNLSEAIVANFRPGQFASTASKTDTNNAALVFVLAGIVNAFAAYILFRAALLFVGRLLIFWFLMIISPFAFVSMALPKGNIFSWWWGTLVSQAFMAPTFLFLLYLIMQVISSKVLNGFNMSTPDSATFFFASVIGPILVAVMIILALHQILKITEGMAGELGRMAQKYAGQALGVGAAVASGGASMAVGGGSSLLLKGSAGKYLREKAKGDGFGGRLATRATLMADKAQKGSWDVRNIGGKDSMFGATVGGYIGQGVGSLGIGKGGNKGGYQKAAKEKAEATTKKDAERAKTFEMSKGEEEKMTEELTSMQKGAHEDAEKIVKTLEDSVKEKEEKVKDAEKVVNNSPEGIRVTTAKETFDKKDKEAKEIAEKNKKEIEALEKEKSEAKESEEKDLEAISAIEKKIETLKGAVSDAEVRRKNAEQELTSATEAPEIVAKNKALSEAKEVLGAEKGKLKDAREETGEKKKLYEDAKKDAKEAVEKEQADRREAYAQKTGTSKITRFATGAAIVGAGATMGPAGVVAGADVARTINRGFRKANEERVKKIRKGKTPEEKEEESLSKALKKAMADQKKKEEKEGEGEKEEKEHKK